MGCDQVGGKSALLPDRGLRRSSLECGGPRPGPVLEEPTASYARSGDSLITRSIGRLQSTLCTRAGRRRRQRATTDTAPVYGDNASTKQLLSL